MKKLLTNVSLSLTILLGNSPLRAMTVDDSAQSNFQEKLEQAVSLDNLTKPEVIKNLSSSDTKSIMENFEKIEKLQDEIKNLDTLHLEYIGYLNAFSADKEVIKDLLKKKGYSANLLGSSADEILAALTLTSSWIYFYKKAAHKMLQAEQLAKTQLKENDSLLSKKISARDHLEKRNSTSLNVRSDMITELVKLENKLNAYYREVAEMARTQNKDTQWFINNNKQSIGIAENSLQLGRHLLERRIEEGSRIQKRLTKINASLDTLRAKTLYIIENFENSRGKIFDYRNFSMFSSLSASVIIYFLIPDSEYSRRYSVYKAKTDEALRSTLGEKISAINDYNAEIVKVAQSKEYYQAKINLEICKNYLLISKQECDTEYVEIQKNKAESLSSNLITNSGYKDIEGIFINRDR